jgi:hypothetical protein
MHIVEPYFLQSVVKYKLNLRELLPKLFAGKTYASNVFVVCVCLIVDKMLNRLFYKLLLSKVFY